MDKMKYRGYTARIEFDEVDRIFVGHLAGIKDIVGFHGTTVDELENAFRESVDHYIAISEQQGRPAQKPYSGSRTFRNCTRTPREDTGRRIAGFRMKFTPASMACCSNLANCRYGKRFGRSSPTR